jgi:hypothetical protein
MSERDKVFVPSWVGYFNWIMLSVPVGFILGVAMGVMSFGFHAFAQAVEAGMLRRLGTPAVIAVMAAVLARLTVPWLGRVSVGKDRITGRDRWGRRTTLAWDDIERTQQVNIIGLKSLRVSSRCRGTALWLPGDVLDNPDFAVAVIECAGPTNPLSAHLTTRRMTAA